MEGGTSMTWSEGEFFLFYSLFLFGLVFLWLVVLTVRRVRGKMDRNLFFDEGESRDSGWFNACDNDLGRGLLSSCANPRKAISGIGVSRRLEFPVAHWNERMRQLWDFLVLVGKDREMEEKVMQQEHHISYSSADSPTSHIVKEEDASLISIDMDIDLGILVDEDPSLAELLVNDITVFNSLLTDVCRHMLATKYQLMTNAFVRVIPTCIPFIPEYSTLDQSISAGLVRIDCVVTALACPSIKEHAICFVCTKERHTWFSKQHDLDSSSSLPQHCLQNGCKAMLDKDPSRSVWISEQKVCIQVTSFSSDPPKSASFTSIHCHNAILSGGAVGGVTVGDRLSGILFRCTKTLQWEFYEILGMNPALNPIQESLTHAMPLEISLEGMFTLLSTMFTSILPVGSAMSLKLALLLSLGCNNEEMLPLLVSSLCPNIRRLVHKFAQIFAPASTVFSNSNPVVASVGKVLGINESCLVAGPLSSVQNNGVIICLEPQRLTPKQKAQFLSALTLKMYQLDASHLGIDGDGEPIPAQVAVSATLWMLSDARLDDPALKEIVSNTPLSFHVDSTLQRSRQYEDNDDDDFHHIASRKLFLDTKNWNHNEDDNSTNNFVLSMISARKSDDKELELSVEAGNLLRQFFLASRATRKKHEMHQSSLGTMIMLAKNFAALCRHTQVEKEDALVGIWLHEESLTHRYGYSVLGFTKTTTHNCGLNVYNGDTLSDKFSAFTRRVTTFCSNFSSITTNTRSKAFD
eukprot:m.66427 g.66427  ORF g.66427 m.66427 type:complete len:748 (-) comp8188_c0_seq5:2238-4481(-)